MFKTEQTYVQRFILPKTVLPNIPPKVLELFSDSYWEIIDQYLLVFCYAENWDDINGFFENWLWDQSPEGAGEELENKMLEGMVSLMEIYGDFSMVLGRALHVIRHPPLHWAVSCTAVNELPGGDITVVVTYEWFEDPEDAFRSDIYSATANVASHTFNPQQPTIYNVNNII